MINEKVTRPYTYISVFACGGAVLLLEVCSSRLLSPYFGNSILVWAVLISLTLAFLTLGSYLGGRLADKLPGTGTLGTVMAGAGGWILLSLWLSPTVLGWTGKFSIGWGVTLSSFYLLAVPCVLLGGVTPFAMRLLAGKPEHTGTLAGTLMAVSTAGGILGAVLPVTAGIPTIGTRLTVTIMGAILVITGGLAFPRGLFVLLLIPLTVHTPHKSGVESFETVYAEYQMEHRQEERILTVNGGSSVFSVWRPRGVILGMRTDVCTLAPYMLPESRRWTNRKVLMLGLGGGSWVEQYNRTFDDLTFDGVEVDPGLIAWGKKYFYLDSPNLTIHLVDARRYLQSCRDRYDVILVDLYLGDRVPPHLATLEFFRMVKEHLTPDGVVVINFPPEFSSIGTATAGQVLPRMCTIDGVIFASASPGFGPVQLAGNIKKIKNPQVRSMVRQILDHKNRVVIGPGRNGQVVTDDSAPLM